MPEQKTGIDEVVTLVQNITGGVPAGVADVVESLKKGNFPQLKSKLEEMGLPLTASLEEKRKWWSENWRNVRSYSTDELKNDFKNPIRPRS